MNVTKVFAEIEKRYPNATSEEKLRYLDCYMEGYTQGLLDGNK